MLTRLTELPLIVRSSDSELLHKCYLGRYIKINHESEVKIMALDLLFMREAREFSHFRGSE